MSINLIWAQNGEGVIGLDGDLPWHVPEDMAHFRNTTRGKTVIMGRATWQSLPEAFRPLPGRRNVVLTRDETFDAPGAHIVNSVDAALAEVAGDEAWVIGGGQIYEQFLPHADRCVITKVDQPGLSERQDVTYAPKLSPQWRVEASDPELGWHLSKSSIRYRFESYTRINVNER